MRRARRRGREPQRLHARLDLRSRLAAAGALVRAAVRAAARDARRRAAGRMRRGGGRSSAGSSRARASTSSAMRSIGSSTAAPTSRSRSSARHRGSATPAGDYIAARAAAWSVPWRRSSTTSTSRGRRLPARTNCVAVRPSLVDNLPNTVLEAVSLGIPFVASAVGGTAELIDPLDHGTHTFDARIAPSQLDPLPPDQPRSRLDAGVLADRLAAVLDEAPAPARPGVDAGANEAAHVRWHGQLAAHAAALRAGSGDHPAAEPAVRIGVCMAGSPTDETTLEPVVTAFAEQDGATVRRHRRGDVGSRRGGVDSRRPPHARGLAAVQRRHGAAAARPDRPAVGDRGSGRTRRARVPAAPAEAAGDEVPDWRWLVPFGGPPLSACSSTASAAAAPSPAATCSTRSAASPRTPAPTMPTTPSSQPRRSPASRSR